MVDSAVLFCEKADSGKGYFVLGEDASPTLFLERICVIDRSFGM